MYNFPGSPYGQPPGFGGFPPGQGPPPGMGAPPGMAAPGTELPQGMMQQQQQQPQQQQSRAGFPPNFNAPANMPNINFSAPVIRLGTSGPSKGGMGEAGGRGDSGRSRAGLGSHADGSRQQTSNNMAVLIPPTKDEINRTIFVGGITEGVGGDEGMQQLLSSVGTLKKWIRATDSDGKNCRFGFAEYEDPDSLATAIEVLKDVQVPVKLQSVKAEGDDVETDVEKSSLLILADDGTMDYLEENRASKDDFDPIQSQLRENAAKSRLAAVLAELEHPTKSIDRSDVRNGDLGNSLNANGEFNGDGEGFLLSTNIDEELADIPAEMRETVAKEIAAFRERSNRRDLERLKREEEIEAMERQRNAPRASRLASPPRTAPSGPNGSVPMGPKDRGLANAPSGPKGYQGVQVPRDYQKGVSFVNGVTDYIDRQDEDTDASDEELEKRRKEKKEAEQEKAYLDQERRWLNRERSRAAAIEREQTRDKDEDGKRDTEQEAAARKYKEWNDHAEAKKGTELYYADHSLWIRNRAAFRVRENNLDDGDRAAEDRERAREDHQQNQARGLADDFLNRQAIEMESKAPTTTAPQEPQRFKLSLGAATQRAQAAAATHKRTMAEVEGLLEDEEEGESTTKRTLVPIKFDSSTEPARLTEEERQQAARQLAAEIPSDKDGLWAWDVKWDFVDETVLNDQLKPFVEKKIVEYLGVQEQMLVEAVEGHIRSKGKPQDLVELLEGPLDEEAEVLVRKLWRMLIFFSESEKRGISN